MKREAIINDSDLIVSYIHNSDQDSINTLLERHRSRVYGYILTMVKDPATAEDITQDTFVKAVSTIDRGKYNESGKFISWMLRIAHNMVVDHFRASKNVTVTNDDVGYDIIAHSGISTASIETEIITDQVAEQVRNLVSCLPDEQREVVELRHFKDLSFKEIADQTGVSINTALGRMRYALINMRKIVDDKQLSLV
ncbi:MAG: sigma-70 family RNA polymerase sigma factor [Rikenellaceae bacterium]